jgi:hypothetical protein
MSADGELSDIIFKALIARRELLRRSTAAQSVEIVGNTMSAATLALRTYAASQRLIHLWFDAATPESHAMMESSGLTGDDQPAVVIATGARYRALPLERWPDFEGAGIYYAATELEARSCAGSPVAVIGGANSAGQAALYLAGRGSEVSLVVRGPDIATGMSAYLVDRLLAHPRVVVQCQSEVTRLDGSDFLEEGQHHQPGDRHHPGPAVLGLILLHRRRAGHTLADRDRHRGQRLHPHRRPADQRRPRPGLGQPRTAATAVRDQRAGRVRGRRRPFRLDEAGRRCYWRGRQRDRLSTQGHQLAPLATG